MKGILILTCMLTMFSGVSALEFKPKTQFSQGVDSIRIWDTLEIRTEPRIKQLLEQHINQNSKNKSTNGYRLQIYFGSGPNAHAEANKIKTNFLSSWPDEKAYLIFKSPDFKVLVGNYRTKSEALKMMKTLTSQFPNAFIVADEIEFPDLNTNNGTN